MATPVDLPDPDADLHWEADTTYVAFVVGDGDNVSYVLDQRARWIRQRLDACVTGSCPPLTWTLSPHLPRLAPDILDWYVAAARQTGQDLLALPPSGHLYAYPSSLDVDDQGVFVAETEADAALLDTHTTVHWEWFDSWEAAETSFLPRYAEAGVVQGIIPVNVPYMLDAFPDWPEDRFYEVLDDRVVVFRPRQWRGVDDRDDTAFQSPANMAALLGSWPKGTVMAIYMTSDGGLDLENSYLALLDLLPEHVRLVSADTAARLAIEAGAR